MASDFGTGFRWGVGTSSYQIEGACSEDGRGPSIYDTKDDSPSGFHGEGADDHYHHVDEDIRLLKKLGVTDYRFSISWTRLFPEGRGRLNEKGKAFYLSLVRKLLDNGITPWLGLFHWDYPQALEDQGGWLNPEAPKWFEDYASAVAGIFDGLVSHYTTINEPQTFVEQGFVTGVKAPYKKMGRLASLEISQAVLLANAKAERALRAHSSQPIQVGMVNTGLVGIPFDPSDENDVEAARQATFAGRGDLFGFGYFDDAAFFGRYPAAWLDGFHEPAFKANQAEMKAIKGHWDFYAANIYGGFYVKSVDGKPALVEKPSMTRNSLGWGVTPEALYWGPKFLYERYHLPIVITENGIPAKDAIASGGRINDRVRCDYIRDYLGNLKKAVGEGIPVNGYFYWSLLDNYEWEYAYEGRFGLVYVDFATKMRTPKDSFFFYRGIIADNGSAL